VHADVEWLLGWGIASCPRPFPDAVLGFLLSLLGFLPVYLSFLKTEVRTFRVKQTKLKCAIQ
jgi:hypothetical protein